MNITMNELLLLLGEKDVIIYQLNKEIATLRAKLTELESKE